MSTRNDVLKALMATREAVSGEWLARQLGVSRNAVWKAIRQLRGEGYRIEAVTNLGYRLVEAPDRISQPEIERWLMARTIGARMEIHDRLDSTNTRAKAIAATGAPHGYLVIAESQSGGRGRFGRACSKPCSVRAAPDPSRAFSIPTVSPSERRCGGAPWKPPSWRWRASRR